MLNPYVPVTTALAGGVMVREKYCAQGRIHSTGMLMVGAGLTMAFMYARLGKKPGITPVPLALSPVSKLMIVTNAAGAAISTYRNRDYRSQTGASHCHSFQLRHDLMSSMRMPPIPTCPANSSER